MSGIEKIEPLANALRDKPSEQAKFKKEAEALAISARNQIQLTKGEEVENPGSDYIRRLIELFEKGLEDEEGSIGYHGTSLEAIEFLIKTGHLPGGTGENLQKIYVQKGNLHFFPIKSRFAEHPLAETFPDEEEVIGRTASYAKSIAQEHYFLRQLGLDIDNKGYGYKARILVSEMYCDESLGFYERLIAGGISKETLDKTIAEANKRRGVVISLSKKLLESYTPTNGDKGEGDLKIHFPNGLDYNDISGLEPMGQEEWNYFEKMQKEHA